MNIMTRLIGFGAFALSIGVLLTSTPAMAETFVAPEQAEPATDQGSEHLSANVSGNVSGSFSGHLSRKAVAGDPLMILCDSLDGDTHFQVDLEEGVANEAPTALDMFVYDPTVSEANSLIAHFDAEDGLLNNTNGVLVGYVDPKNPKTGRKGERIGGTRLGALRSVMLDLNIDLISKRSRKAYSGQAIYLKKNGDQLVQDLTCTIE